MNHLRILVCTTLLFVAGRAEANLFDMYGADPQAVGMAGAYSSLATGASGAYYNPGALAAASNDESLLSMVNQTQSLKLNSENAPIDQTQGTLLGFGNGFKIGGQQFGFGSLFFFPTDRVIRVISQDPRTPNYLFYDNYPNRLTTYLGLAWEAAEDLLYVGGGIQLLADISGGIDVTFTFIPPGLKEGYVSDNPCAQTERTDCELVDGDVPQRLYPGIFFDETLKLSIFPNFGMLFTPGDRLRFSAVYREEFLLEVDIPEEVTTTVPFIGPIPLETSVRVDTFYQPRTYVLGAAYGSDFKEEGAAYAVSLDLTYQEFSEFVSNELVLRVFNLEDVEEDAGFTIIERAGAEPKFKDTLSLRLGWRHRVSEAWRYNAGYAFIPSPVPDQTQASNFLDSDRHLLAAGASFHLGEVAESLEGLSLEFGGQLHLFTERSYKKENPADNIGRIVDFDVPIGNASPANMVLLHPGEPRGELEGWVGAFMLGVRYTVDP